MYIYRSYGQSIIYIQVTLSGFVTAIYNDGVSLNIGEDTPVPPAQDAVEPSAAQGLLIQANMMKEDAERLIAEAAVKEQQAYDADPSLKPKRGRGRPKKTA